MSQEIKKQLNSLQKTINKYGKYIEELEKEVAILKTNSHPRTDFVCTTCGSKAKRVRDNINEIEEKF
tara:strand:- start:192 stop:392 length:201 start_codon:yes stop_codon:yes gene_type:complete